MGLFKKAVNIALPGAAITSKLVTGKSLGGHVEKALGLEGGDPNIPQINPNLSEMRADVGRVRDISTGKVKDLRLSAIEQLNQAQEDTDKYLGAIQAAAQGGYNANLDAIAETGGLDSGASERLARTGQRDRIMQQQELLSDMGRTRAGIRSADFADQENQKFRATLVTPQLSGEVAKIQTQADAANMQAAAIAKANQKGLFGSIGKLGGMAVGGALGGPMGMAMGGAAGGLFGSYMA